MRRECVFVMFVCSATAYGALPDMDLCDGGYPVMALTETTDESTETTTKTAECVPYVADIENCPDGYNNVFSNNSMHVVADGIECPVGTHVVVPYDGSNLSDSSLMSIYEYPYTNEMETKLAVRLCKVGQEMNYLGNCADLCAPTSGGVNMQYLRTSGGLVIPIYATKLTTPSLNFRKANRRCYANLVPEKSNDAINVMYKDNYYHAVK